ncbi:hypothetical protein AHF37_09964 [Paragonimus kellicotti]|nr:hypothetical protein AHF37_09964 [Paragonimus kellicotti]
MHLKLRLQDDEFWNPRLLLDNAQGEPMEIVSHEVEFVEPDFEAYLVEKRRIKGVFHETLELRHFPFDCQVGNYDFFNCYTVFIITLLISW